MKDNEADYHLDCSGLNCPFPVLKTKKAMDTLKTGQILKMISTDQGSVNDIAAWGKRTGKQVLESLVEGDKLTFYLKKT